MRTALALVLVASLIAGPVWGAQPKGRNFDTAVCAQNIPCGSDYGEDGANVSSIIAKAGDCIANQFGLAAYTEFDESLGFDSSRCLIAKPKTASKSGGSQAVSHCCLRPMENAEGMCQLICEEYVSR